MDKKNKTTNAVEILHRRYIKDDAERKISVQEERVNATILREAARVCHAAEDQKEWGDTFEKFLVHLNTCCEKLDDAIEACYVNIGDDCLRIFMTTPGEDYDISIDDRITEIDIELAREFPSCPADCVQVPHDFLGSFFSVKNSLKVYG